MTTTNHLRPVAASWHELEISVAPVDHDLAAAALNSWRPEISRVVWLHSPLAVFLTNAYLRVLHERCENADWSSPFWNQVGERAGEPVVQTIQQVFDTLRGRLYGCSSKAVKPSL